MNVFIFLIVSSFFSDGLPFTWTLVKQFAINSEISLDFSDEKCSQFSNCPDDENQKIQFSATLLHKVL
jgi:hypothetical protein